MRHPFVHEELEVKQNFLTSAREFAVSQEPEKQFAAALLYANLADYLATHLHESIKLACHNATRTYYNGSLTSIVRDESGIPLGKVIQGLDGYLFPSKDLIVPLLKKIKKNRDKIMHGLVKSPSKEIIETAEKSFSELTDDVEQLVVYIDDIYRSLPPRTVLETFGGDSKIEDPNKTDETDQAKKQTKEKK